MRSRQEIYIWIVQYQNNSCHKRTVPDNVTSLEPASRRRKTTKKKKKTATGKKRNIKEEGSAFGTRGEIAPLSLPGKFYGQDFETQPEAGRSLVCLSLLFADDVNLLSTFNKGKKMYSISKKKKSEPGHFKYTGANLVQRLVSKSSKSGPPCSVWSTSEIGGSNVRTVFFIL